VRYYGGKTKLLKFIEDAVSTLNIKPNSLIVDAFSGTAVVGKHLKNKGFTVYSNDFLEFAYNIACTYIEINSQPTFKKLNLSCHPIEYLNNLVGKVGFITSNYSPFDGCERMYLSVDNAKKVDAIREQIECWWNESKITNLEKNYLITSLLEAINLRSNVTGTYAAFLKSWDSRALKPLELSMPHIINSNQPNKAFKGDANQFIKTQAVDVIYLDPPYNSRQYASNYFFLEVIAEGWFQSEPQIYGMSGMRPYEHQKSKYSSIKTAELALADLVYNADTKYILMSYNNEGLISHDAIKTILNTRGRVTEFGMEHKRYRAINQDGSNVKTKESLFLLRLEK
jgi:adenine-specific DNA-methyltransferase